MHNHCFRTCYRCKIWAPSENSSPLGVPSCSRAWFYGKPSFSGVLSFFRYRFFVAKNWHGL